MAMPARKSSAVVPAESPRSIPIQMPATTTGMKTTAGTEGGTREKKSRKRLSNIGGESESRAVHSCAIGADLSESRFRFRICGVSGTRDQPVKKEGRHCGKAPDGKPRRGQCWRRAG